MKTGKKTLSIFLILLIISVFAFAPVSAKKQSTNAKKPSKNAKKQSKNAKTPSTNGIGELTVSIGAINVLDLEEGGEDNDVLLHGTVGIQATQTGTYEVSLTLTMKYLGTNTVNPIEKKSKLDMTLHKTITVYCEAGVLTEAYYTFQIYNKIGWYRGQVTAKYERLIAESNIVEFDPPGGSRGPVWF